MRIAVCISTFHRPEGLAQVLASIAVLELPDPAPEVTVVVVNNDPDDERPARICTHQRSAHPFDIAYLTERQRGLAAPRNLALDHALPDHDLIAFIDDDEIATPSWLARLIEALRRWDADAVAGPVVPRFASPPPEVIVRGGFFAPPRRASGTPLAHAFTNNVLIRTSVIRELGLRFDDRFGLIGGEDTHFFRRFHRGGGRIVWAADAVVEDCVPDERATPRWIAHRQRRAGMTTACIERDLRPAVAAVPLVAARAAASIALGGGLLVAGVVTGAATRLRGRCWLAWGRGLAEGLAGRTYREYLEER